MPVREPDRVDAVPDAGVERTVVSALPSSPVASEASIRPMLYIGASSLNVRQGPSTGTSVVERLTRGEAVSVVKDLGDGWVQIQIEGDGVDGYVASRFLTADPFAN